MPEGDSIFKAARRLNAALSGKTVQRAVIGHHALGEPQLVGRVVRSVEARGKHLWIAFDDGRALHTHLGMQGAWRVWQRKAALEPSPRLRIALDVGDAVAVCFDAKVCELTTVRALARPERLGSLGPDLIADEFDAEAARASLRAAGAQAVGEALMDQRRVAGIGNVFKSEVLFLCRVHPLTKASALDDATLDALIATARKLLRRNRGRGMRRTRRATGGPAHHVYGRFGQLCLECGAELSILRQGALRRTTTFCPGCQAL